MRPSSSEDRTLEKDQEKREQPATSKLYDVYAYCEGDAHQLGPFECLINRDDILDRFKELLPNISLSSLGRGTSQEAIFDKDISLVVYPARMARAWVVLMKRLGYSRFASQGGDWGAFVTNEMAQQAPPELIGIHLNFTGTAPSDVAKALQSGQPAPAGLSAEEQRAYNQLVFVFQHLPTQTMMAAHPQTLYGLADSPVALAAWMTDHDITSYGHIAKLFVDGEPYGDITRDDILDNITHYWLTNTGVSSSRLSHEYKGAFINDLSISVPAAVSVFPEEIYQAPRSWTERAYHNLIHFNALDKCGHFAAWEQPQLFSEEVRAGLRSLHQ